MFCSKCGSPINGAKFCTNCGQQAPSAAPTPGFQQAPPQQSPYGMPMGMIPQRPPKSRTSAILLAVFLSGWTWVYTYRADSQKFWLSMVASFLLSLMNFALPGIGLLGIGLWIWALVDVTKKDERWYQTYWNNYPG